MDLGVDKMKLQQQQHQEMFLDDPDVVERCPNNRYVRYNELLGRGASKTVYKGFDEVEGIEIAWNQVMLDDVMQSSEHLERVYSEVHFLKTLKHENIIKSYVSWVDDKNKTVNMITELFTSGSLRQYRKKHKSVDLKAIKNWARQILKGLTYLHSQEPPIIHRDLKCDNIFVNGNHGEVKIGDLGLATLMLPPAVKSLIGTPEFMAPELYEEEYNELVDIYSFGMCILELITCEYPYSECRNQAQIYRKVTSGIKPAGLSKVKDPQVKEFIEKCLVPVSQRLPAKELLKDPFLSIESIKERVHEPITLDLVNLSMPNSCPMDVDHIDNKMSSGNTSVESNTSSPHFPSAKVQNVNERNNIQLKGEMTEENSVTINLRLDVFTGKPQHVEFSFYLEEDTAYAIAQEMVEELDLVHEDIAVVTELIDDLISKFVPTWKPSSKMSSPKSSVILQMGQLELEPPTNVSEAENNGCKGSGNSSFTYSGDWMKSSSNCSSLFQDDDRDRCEDLKQELDAIDAQYHQWFSVLQKNKEEAIETAKKKWDLKKKALTF
ncbi:probable serine/threonine-protein kinase WNK10 isoform X1 [Tanacetum coccineum]